MTRCWRAFRQRAQSSSYGEDGRRVQARLGLFAPTSVLIAAALAAVLAWAPAAGAAERPVKIVALGDSLTAGLGIAAEEGFPVKLERALQAKGHAVEVVNAGVSGDTAAGGLARLDWSVPEGTEAVIVELGANDALRGVDPEATRRALDEILRRLNARRIVVLLAGMRAPPNMGPDYVRRFDAIYADLAGVHDVILYPFFLDRVAADAALNQRDGIHPTAAGVDMIVRGLLPKAEELVRKALAARKSQG
jgi:acyl-CoA thioesterase I